MTIFRLMDYRHGNQESHGMHLFIGYTVKENGMIEKCIVINHFGMLLECISLKSLILERN